MHIGLLPGSGGLDIRKITLQEITVIGTYWSGRLAAGYRQVPVWTPTGRMKAAR